MKVLITGASSGIGREMARILAKTSDEMVLVGRNKERLENIKKELGNQSIIKIISTDLSNIDNCMKLYKENKNIDLLINNAGFGDYGNFTETSLEKELEMINTNIVACHILTKLYLKDMEKENKGRIINVASIAGFMPGPLMTTYYATKSYVVRLSEAIREELRRKKSNVKIHILCPGPVATNFEKNANVKFQFNGISSYKVAKYTLNHLNKFYIVPTFGTKLSRLFLQIIPGSISSKIIYKIQSKRKTSKI